MKPTANDRRFARWNDPASSEIALRYYMTTAKQTWASRVMAAMHRLTAPERQWFNADDVLAEVERITQRREQRNVVSKVLGTLADEQMLVSQLMTFFDPVQCKDRELIHYRLPTPHDVQRQGALF